MKILHISDLHFHRSKNDNRAITKTLKFIGEKYPDHYIIITGDIVDDGDARQYDNAYDALKQFMGRIFIVPGNHDFGALGNLYSRERAKRFDEKLSIPLNQGSTFLADNKPVVNVIKDKSDSALLVGLDTNLETEHPWDFACGKIGSTQLKSLATILDNVTVPEMKKIVFFHHHPFMHNNPFMELKDAKKLPPVVYNKVDVILFGHKHEMKNWKNIWGAQFVLASDNSPGKEHAGEITIENGNISMNFVKIK